MCIGRGEPIRLIGGWYDVFRYNSDFIWNCRYMGISFVLYGKIFVFYEGEITMGMSPFHKSCFTDSSAKAPNPNPSRWTLIDIQQFPNGYVLKVKYDDCDNFEGIKVMVYKGQYKPVRILDPHFDNTETSPIARFRPDTQGWIQAIMLAKIL